MAHNPFNDLYVESLEPIMSEARHSWEIASAICNREVRNYHPKQLKSRARHANEHTTSAHASGETVTPTTSYGES
jgi:hypothetical protein